MKTTIAVLFILLMCASCREETTNSSQVQRMQAEPLSNQKSNECFSAIEREMSNMPQKLAGKGWDTMFWGSDLVKGIMAIDDRDKRVSLMNRCLDSVARLETTLKVQHDISQAFRNYELLIDTCTMFESEPEITERILGIMCDCVRLHRQEVEKWAGAISNEPNHRKRVSMKNVHGCLYSYFMVFTNRIERTYFPRMKSHGLPPDRHEIWRQRINDAEGK